MAESGRALGDRTVPLSCPFCSLHPLQLYPNTYPLVSPVFTQAPSRRRERVRISLPPAPVRSMRLPRGGRGTQGHTARWVARDVNLFGPIASLYAQQSREWETPEEGMRGKAGVEEAPLWWTQMFYLFLYS